MALPPWPWFLPSPSGIMWSFRSNMLECYLSIQSALYRKVSLNRWSELELINAFGGSGDFEVWKELHQSRLNLRSLLLSCTGGGLRQEKRDGCGWGGAMAGSHPGLWHWSVKCNRGSNLSPAQQKHWCCAWCSFGVRLQSVGCDSGWSQIQTPNKTDSLWRLKAN